VHTNAREGQRELSTQEQYTQEDWIVLVSNGSTQFATGMPQWSDQLSPIGVCEASTIGLSVRKALRQIGVGAEREIGWIVSGLGCAQQTAYYALMAARLGTNLPELTVDQRLNTPMIRRDSLGYPNPPSTEEFVGAITTAAAAVTAHHAQAGWIQRPDTASAARVLVGFGHADIWKGVITLLTSDGRVEDALNMSLPATTVVVLHRVAGQPQYRWVDRIRSED